MRRTQAGAIEQAAQAIAQAIQADHLVYIFGATHAGILAQEMFYRAGGLVPVNPILPPGLTTDVRPVTLTSRLERLPGFGSRGPGRNARSKPGTWSSCIRFRGATPPRWSLPRARASAGPMSSR